MFTIIKHIKKGVIIFFFQKSLCTKPMHKLPFTFFMVLVYRRTSIFFPKIMYLSLRMDLMCRGSKKYFALMLYRLFSAEHGGTVLQGNVNLIYCWWVYYEGWPLLGFPVFQPLLLE